ncbi:tetratricopeptide repeat protein [Paracraurococcus lichenis]|uniref:Tetratricopeptide repeat protein n=1 Tax=Paracraurococcus lichenis TaxID=3064888 RepID=A0ABT9E812_9PROT|nr:tetratricopeptide repeat protein [Paracraurococcus sp. LOR1-02]MDO9712314.1 tetratricopeptide repeat protein [Paracraurococcus sp. LOR1-02]
MQFPGSSPRLLLLAAALLSACAAGGAPGSRAPRSASGLPITGAFGAYLAGRFASAETDTEAAADNMLAALKADPDQPEVLNRAFLATLLDGRSEATRLARRLPDNPAANLLLAGTDVQAGRWDRAEQRLKAIGRGGPVQVLQPVLLAWVQLGRGQPDQALATLRPLAESNRLRALNALHAALIADIAARPREAERFARMAVADQPQPTWRLAVLAAGVLARAGKAAEGQRLLEQIAGSGEDAALAATEAMKRGALAARGVASPAEGWAEAHTALAGALRAQGSGDFALILAQLAVRLRPGFGPALVLTADTLADQGHDEDALAALNRVPAEDILAPVVGLRRAGLLDKLDRTEEAVAVLRKLAEAYPTLPQAPARLGDLLRRRNRFAEAAVAYDQALSRIGRPGMAEWPLLYSRGIARERSGDWPRAEADLLRALELSPEQPYVLNYLGYTWAEQGKNLDRAKAMLLRATELRPQDGNIADSLGWVLFRLGDLPGAVTWLEKAVELEPRNAVVNDHLGDAYWAGGRQREARFQWQRALTMEPEPEDLVKIEAKLKDGLPGYPASTAQR